MDLWAQYGLAGLVAGATLALVWKVVDRGWSALESRIGGDDSVHPAGLNRLQCQVDPLHFQRIQEVHTILEAWDSKVDRGEFSCAWRDRDEIRDLLEAIRSASSAASTREAAHLTALAELTKEVRNLAGEIRTTRNGGR